MELCLTEMTEGDRLVLLTCDHESTRNAIYVIGGAISPSFMKTSQGAITEQKHPNLIHTAINDAFRAIEAVRRKAVK